MSQNEPLGVVDNHPQRDAIIGFIVAGDALRSIVSRVSPSVSIATLSRFRRRVLAQALEPIRAQGNNRQLKEIAIGGRIIPDTTGIVASQTDVVKRRIQEAIEASSNRRAKWITDAEEKPLLDELGMPIIVNGKPLSNLDHRALAAHDRNNLSALDLQAKIAGAYAENPTTVSVTNVVMIPAGRDRDEALPVIAALGAAGEVIELSHEECSDMDPLMR